MRAIDVLACLPAPTQPVARLDCDEVLYQELVVLGALGFAEGTATRGEARHLYVGRLTKSGLARLEELQRRERGDA